VAGRVIPTTSADPSQAASWVVHQGSKPSAWVVSSATRTPYR
jgi:hypothetical protein